MKFKLGDRVKLINLKNGEKADYDTCAENTIGNVGVVIRLLNQMDCFSYTVQWDNGLKAFYNNHNLEFEKDEIDEIDEEKEEKEPTYELFENIGERN